VTLSSQGGALAGATFLKPAQETDWVGILATSPILMAIPGKSPGTRIGNCGTMGAYNFCYERRQPRVYTASPVPVSFSAVNPDS
jgi:hypothetical protein